MATLLQPRYQHSVALGPDDAHLVDENLLLMGGRVSKADMFREALRTLNKSLKEEKSP